MSVTEIYGEYRTKQEIAEEFKISVRSLERLMTKGLPRRNILGKVRFRASEVEPWLEEHGYLEKRGEVDG